MNIKRVCQFLPDREAEKPDAKLRYRIKWNRNKNIVAFNVGYRVDVEKWSAETQRCKNNTTHGKKKVPANIINREIQRFEKIADDVFTFFEKADKEPSTDEYRREFNKMLGKNAVKTTGELSFFDVFDIFTEKVSVLNSWSKGTKAHYKVLKGAIKQYDSNTGFNTLSEDYLIGFMKSMFDKELHNSTVAKKISGFKGFLRWARKNKYYTGELHETFKINLKGSTELINEPVYLTWDELIHLYSLEIPDGKKYLERVRDVLCFCSFSSLRYSDVENLMRSDVKDNHIVIVTQKTVEGIKIELNKYTRAILEKYKDMTFGKGRVLPVISNQRMNDYIKELAEFAGFNELIKVVWYVDRERKEEILPKYALMSSHCGRRTFIVNSLYLGIPAEVVMKWTGHEDYNAMKPYIAIVDKLKTASMRKFDEKE